jgi:hypothetical protein
MSEAKIQSDFHYYIWNNYKKTRYLCYHIPNEGFRKAQSQMIHEGLIPGMCDYICNFPSRGYKGLYIEFKIPGEKPGKNQVKAIDALRAHGFRVEVVFSFEEALKLFQTYAEGTEYLHQ